MMSCSVFSSSRIFGSASASASASKCFVNVANTAAYAADSGARIDVDVAYRASTCAGMPASAEHSFPPAATSVRNALRSETKRVSAIALRTAEPYKVREDRL